MTSELEQLKIAYETLQMSPEEIATDRELELTAVKAGLMQCSSLYRKRCGQADPDDETLNFTAQDLRDVNEVIKRIALYGQDENLQLRAATYIRDDKKGRKEVIRAVGNTTFNLLQFNESMKAVRDGANKMKGQLLGDINV